MHGRRHVNKSSERVTRCPVLGTPYRAVRNALCGSVRAHLIVYEAYADERWQWYTRWCYGCRRFRLFDGNERALAKLFDELESDTADSTRRMVVVRGAGRFLVRICCTPATSTSPCNECRNRIPRVLIDTSGRMDMHHERGCTLKLVKEKKRVKQRPPDERVRCSLIDRHSKKQPTLRHFLWCDATGDNTSKRFLRRIVNALISRRDSVVPLERPPSLCLA